MNFIEKKSRRKADALIELVKIGYYPLAYAIIEAERLNDEGKLLDSDYEDVMDYFESLATENTETTEKVQATETAEDVENVDNTEESNVVESEEEE